MVRCCLMCLKNNSICHRSFPHIFLVIFDYASLDIFPPPCLFFISFCIFSFGVICSTTSLIDVFHFISLACCRLSQSLKTKRHQQNADAFLYCSIKFKPQIEWYSISFEISAPYCIRKRINSQRLQQLTF